MVNDSASTPPVEEMQTTVVSASEQVGLKNKRVDPEMVMPIMLDSLAIPVENPSEMNMPAPFRNGQTFMHIPEPYNEEYLEIPFLTEADKKKNNKRKLQLLKEIVKKKSFSDIPAGPSWRNGERFEVKQFSMQNAEVSNWQYTVFLNELILQARTDDYFACKPVSGNWKAVGIPEFEVMYAETEGHEKDPVLNITRKAAEMYCEWLTTAMNEAINKKEVKWSGTARPDFRLPTDIEWTRAARGNDSTLQFPWGAYYNSLQNTRGCYMCNFNYSISKGSLSPEGPVGSKGCISEKQNLRGVITTAGRAIDTLVLGPEYCYNPTNFGQYCMLGNAAEMVWKYERDPTSLPVALSMGGSWYSHADEVRIESKQQFVGVTEANVAIGFRCAMVLREK